MVEAGREGVDRDREESEFLKSKIKGGRERGFIKGFIAQIMVFILFLCLFLF